MRRAFATLALCTIATMVTAGCGGKSGVAPQPGLSPMAITTSDCAPQSTATTSQHISVTAEQLMTMLDIQPQAKVFRPPAPWNGTVSGLASFGLDTIHSVCDMLSDVYERAKLGGAWSVRLIMATAGQTFRDCQRGGRTLGGNPFVCFTGQLSPGYYFGRILVYPLELLKTQLGSRGDMTGSLVASGNLVDGLMTAALDATFHGTPDRTVSACAAGVWQGTLLASGLRTPATTPAFAAGTDYADAVKYGVANKSIGKCFRKFQHFPSNGGSPSAGVLPLNYVSSYVTIKARELICRSVSSVTDTTISNPVPPIAKLVMPL